LVLLSPLRTVVQIQIGSTISPQSAPVRETVEKLIVEWLRARGRTRSSLQLVVAHSHAHNDHIAGDGQFNNQPYTTLVGITPTEVATFFGITQWPEQVTCPYSPLWMKDLFLSFTECVFYDVIERHL
jgi:hypothetical protein